MGVNIQFLIVYISIAVLFLIALSLLYISYRIKKKSNEIISEKDEEIEKFKRNYNSLKKEFIDSEREYGSLFNYVSDQIYIQDKDGVFIDVNKGAEKLYGYSKQEFIGKTPDFLSAPGKNDLNQLKERLRKAFNGEIQRFEFWGRKKNGVVFPKDVVLNRGEYKNRDVIFAISRDISVRKNTEDRIAKFNECFLSFSIKPDENIKKLVQLSGELFNADYALYNCLIDNELVSVGSWKTPKDFVERDKPEGHICFDVIRTALNRVVVIPSLDDTKYIHTDPDVVKFGLKTYIGIAVKIEDKVTGSLCILFKNKSVLSNEDLKLFSILASAISIEEQRKSAEEQLIKSSNDLKELNITKDKFFSIISHDLKNPFNAILGFSTILSEDYDKLDDFEKKEFINNIRESSISAYKLMDNLLIWSRAQTNKINFEPEELDMCLVALETIESLRPLAIAKDIVLHTGIPLNTIIKVDKNMILTVMRNLVTNGLKFTNPGGSVHISAAKMDKTIRIMIVDTGVGMREDVVNKLFKIDSMFKSEGTKGELGTGLGLILCKEFIEKNHGKIFVESELDKGTKIILEFPKP